MTLWDSLVWIAESLLVGMGLASVIFLAFLGLWAFQGHNVGEVAVLASYDAVSEVACGSDSMGLSFRCGDTVLLREVDRGIPLRPGEVYLYRGENQSIIHRYLGCVDEECTVLFFRGDNNRVGEKVNRSNVEYQVVGMYYRGTL